MKKKTLYIAWFCLFLVTVILGSIEPGSQMMKALMVSLAVCFFIPPAVLLYQGVARKDRRQVRFLRLISAVSLGATFVLLLANFLSAPLPQWAGDLLYAILVVASAPMVCSQYWVVSLFAWACILMTSLMYCPKEKNTGK